MRRLLAGFVLASTIGIGALAGTSGGQVAVCNPDAYGGITARFMACTHELHTGPPADPGEYHSQWRGGIGTPHHTWERYKREARLLRAWLEGLD